MGVTAERPVTVILSLEDPIRELQHHLRHYALESLRKNPDNYGINYGRLVTYDYRTFMLLILNDLKMSMHEAGNSEVLIKHLMDDGVPRYLAEYLTIEITKMVLDHIGSTFPKFSFVELSDSCTFEFHEPNVMTATFPPGTLFV